MRNLAPDTGPTKSRAHVEAPHPQRLGDDRVDCNAAYRSQDAVRVRGEQFLTGDKYGKPTILGGELRIQSTPGNGTQLTVELPTTDGDETAPAET